MATARAARYALRVGQKLAKRRGTGVYGMGKLGRGFGLRATPDQSAKLPGVIAGVPVENFDPGARRREAKKEAKRLRGQVDVTRRRPRRKRRPRPESIWYRLQAPPSKNKNRRERARFRRRAK